jgi:osmotically inducible protein OsmC
VGTNPEELIAAAHSGCFAMQLSAFIGRRFTPESRN